MASFERYIKQAEEAEAQARNASTPEERRTYEDVARLWRQLAERKADGASANDGP